MGCYQSTHSSDPSVLPIKNHSGSNQNYGFQSQALKQNALYTKHMKLSGNAAGKKNTVYKTLLKKGIHQNEKIISKQSKQKIISKQLKQNNDYFILKPLEEIKNILFKKIKYLWLNKIDETINIEQSTLLAKNGFDITVLPNSQAILSKIKESPNYVFHIICSANNIKQIYNQFRKNQHVSKIHIFTKELKDCLEFQGRLKISSMDTDINQLIKSLKKDQKSNTAYILMPNFMIITTKQNKQNNTNINNLRYNLHGLLRYKNKSQAKKDFIDLAKFLFSQQDVLKEISEFENEFPLSEAEDIVLRWYTKQSFYYGLLNNSLRSLKQSQQSSYIRFPFQRTFSAIKSTYDQKNDVSSFLVYRMAMFDQEQLKFIQKNINEYIQIFGFMSTTTDRAVTNNFLGNTLIIVEVTGEKRQNSLDYGYVNIKSNNLSQLDQSQILFNALNVYKIISFQKEMNKNIVRLKYGELARIVLHQNQVNLSQKQKDIVINYQHQQSNIATIDDQGDVLFYSQKFQEASKYKTQYVNQIGNSKSPQEIQNLYDLAKVEDVRGDLDLALKHYQQVLSLDKKVYGQNHYITARTINDIGLVYLHKEQYDKSQKYFQRSLKISEVIGEKQSQATAITLNNLGLVYFKMQEYQRSLEYYNKALQIYITCIGQNNEYTAITLNNIGLTYMTINNMIEAENFYKRALKIQTNTIGQNHIQTALSINNLGLIYLSLEAYDKALENFLKAYTIYDSSVGVSENTALFLNNIGYTKYELNLIDQAINYYKKSQQMYEDPKIGKNKDEYINTMHNMSMAYTSQKQYSKALLSSQKGSKSHKNIYGQDIIFANLLMDQGFFHSQLNHINQAYECYHKAYKIYQSDLGSKDQTTQNSYDKAQEMKKLIGKKLKK